MYHIFRRTTSSSFFSASFSAKVQRNLISSDEITIEDFNKCIDDFKLTEIQKDHVYKTSRLNLFTSDYVIRIEEGDIQLTKAKDEIKLLSPFSIEPLLFLLPLFPLLLKFKRILSVVMKSLLKTLINA